MRIVVSFVGVLTCLAMASSGGVGVEAAQKAKNTITMAPDYPYPSEGIPALWRKSNVVVVGHVIAGKQGVKRNALDDRASVPFVNTTFRVQDVLKPYESIVKGMEITVIVQAGEAELPDRIVRVAPDRWAPLKNGGKYVLFLEADDTGTFRPVYGPNGVYYLTGGLAITQGHSFADSEKELMAALDSQARGR
jgi:hypothetical protein